MKQIICFVAVILLASCGSKESKVKEYQAQYREAQLVGLWVREDTVLYPRDHNGQEKVCFIKDTLVLGYFNDVVSRKKTVAHYANYPQEEEWGVYEIVKGSYSMTNDTLQITLDTTHIERIAFGSEPLGISRKETDIVGKDSISYFFAVKELNNKAIRLVNYLRMWDGENCKGKNREVNYEREGCNKPIVIGACK